MLEGNHGRITTSEGWVFHAGGNHGRITTSEGWVFHAGGISWKNNYLGGVGVPC